MQGDILQLESVVFKSQEPHDMEFRPRATQIADAQPISAQVAIYNEDDLSHLLFANVDPAHHGHALAHDGKTTVNHASQHHYSMLLEHPSGTHTPVSEDDESAVLSDCESEEDENVLPPSPIRPRGGSICSDKVEFPSFLGRQSEPEAQAAVQPPPAAKASKSCSAESSPVKRVRIVPAEHHVWKIDGPMMSWWPGPLETMEYDWAETKVQDEKRVPAEQHVSSIEGPMMMWWPPMQYEWSDVFYE